MTFSISETTFGALPALKIGSQRCCVVVATQGVTVLSWTVDGVSLIDGYVDEGDFASQAGMRSALMIPFSNRIKHGSYEFGGREYDLNAAHPEKSGETVMHGVLRLADFAITDTVLDDEFATIRFVSRALRPGAFAGYPFSIDVEIALTVSEVGIEFAVTGANVGDAAAPFSSGWHPYFTIGVAPIDSLTVTIPAETRIVTDAELIPLPGDDAFAPTADSWDFRKARLLASEVLDLAFAKLQREADGLIHSVLTDPSSLRSIDVWQERGFMHVFTADGLQPPRASFAMEPVEAMTNAFGRPDQADTVRLEPGTRRTFRFGATTWVES